MTQSGNFWIHPRKYPSDTEQHRTQFRCNESAIVIQTLKE